MSSLNLTPQQEAAVATAFRFLAHQRAKRIPLPDFDPAVLALLRGIAELALVDPDSKDALQTAVMCSGRADHGKHAYDIARRLIADAKDEHDPWTNIIVIEDDA